MKLNNAFFGNGVRPSDKDFFAISKNQYNKKGVEQIKDYKLVYDSDTVKAYLDESDDTIILSIRGTSSKEDVKADASIAVNRLKYSNRYLKDKQIIEQIATMYPYDKYDYYLTGHSLGGALINQLKRDFKWLKDSVQFNPAFQPYDLISQQSNENKRYYTPDDPLYSFGGRLFSGNIMVKTEKPTLKMPSNILSDSFNYYQGHSLDNFDKVLGSGYVMNIGDFIKKIKGNGLNKMKIINKLGDLNVADLKTIAKKISNIHKIALTKIKKNDLLDSLNKVVNLDGGNIMLNSELIDGGKFSKTQGFMRKMISKNFINENTPMNSYAEFDITKMKKTPSNYLKTRQPIIKNTSQNKIQNKIQKLLEKSQQQTAKTQAFNVRNQQAQEKFNKLNKMMEQRNVEPKQPKQQKQPKQPKQPKQTTKRYKNQAAIEEMDTLTFPIIIYNDTRFTPWIIWLENLIDKMNKTAGNINRAHILFNKDTKELLNEAVEYWTKEIGFKMALKTIDKAMDNLLEYLQFEDSFASPDDYYKNLSTKNRKLFGQVFGPNGTDYKYRSSFNYNEPPPITNVVRIVSDETNQQKQPKQQNIEMKIGATYKDETTDILPFFEDGRGNDNMLYRINEIARNIYNDMGDKKVNSYAITIKERIDRNSSQLKKDLFEFTKMARTNNRIYRAFMRDTFPIQQYINDGAYVIYVFQKDETNKQLLFRAIGILDKPVKLRPQNNKEGIEIKYLGGSRYTFNVFSYIQNVIENEGGKNDFVDWSDVRVLFLKALTLFNTLNFYNKQGLKATQDETDVQTSAVYQNMLRIFNNDNILFQKIGDIIKNNDDKSLEKIYDDRLQKNNLMRLFLYFNTVESQETKKYFLEDSNNGKELIGPTPKKWVVDSYEKVEKDEQQQQQQPVYKYIGILDQITDEPEELKGAILNTRFNRDLKEWINEIKDLVPDQYSMFNRLFLGRLFSLTNESKKLLNEMFDFLMRRYNYNVSQVFGDIESYLIALLKALNLYKEGYIQNPISSYTPYLDSQNRTNLMSAKERQKENKNKKKDKMRAKELEEERITMQKQRKKEQKQTKEQPRQSREQVIKLDMSMPPVSNEKMLKLRKNQLNMRNSIIDKINSLHKSRRDNIPSYKQFLTSIRFEHPTIPNFFTNFTQKYYTSDMLLENIRPVIPSAFDTYKRRFRSVDKRKLNQLVSDYFNYYKIDKTQEFFENPNKVYKDFSNSLYLYLNILNEYKTLDPLLPPK